MALLLNLLEREANNVYAGKEADFDLMRDIMHYMTVYPDAVHHPKEDKIYAELQSARPDLASGFGRITVDHRGIAEQSEQLHDELALIESGGIVRRNSVVSSALRYVNTIAQSHAMGRAGPVPARRGDDCRWTQLHRP